MQMTIVMNELTPEETLKILDVVAETSAHVYVEEDINISEEEEFVVTVGDIIFIDPVGEYLLVNMIGDENIQFITNEGVGITYTMEYMEKNDFSFHKITPEEAHIFRQELKELGGIDLENTN